MLLSLKKLQEYRLKATDGVVGAIEGFYFVGSRITWMVRYFIIDIKEWFNEKRILVPPDVVGKPEGDLEIPATATKEDIENSRIFLDGSNLLKTNEIVGYTLTAKDGGVGYVEDIILEDDTWEIKYLVVGLLGYAHNKKVLLPVDYIDEVVEETKNIKLTLSKETVGRAPSYEPGKPITQEYEKAVREAYGIDDENQWDKGGG